MSLYTVLEPPQRTGSLAERADRIVFIRDRFSLSAFLFTPLWLIYRALWLVLVAYLLILGALAFAMHRLHLGDGEQILIVILIAWLIGLEAANLRRWTLVRRGWRELGTVVAGDFEEAEQRFFDAWLAGDIATPAARPTGPASIIRPPSPPRDVVGLFPEPGGGR